MKRILFIGLSLVAAIGCGDSKPVSTVDNTGDEASSVASESDGESGNETTEEIESDTNDEDLTADATESTESEPEEVADSFNDEVDVEAEAEVELSLEEQFAKLRNGFLLARSKLGREFQQADAENQQRIEQELSVLQPQFAADARQLFKGNEHDPAFIDVVPWCIMALPDEEAEDVLAKVAEHHLENDKWFDLCVGMVNIKAPAFVNFVEKQATEGSGKSQAAAKFVLANHLNPDNDEERIVELLTSVMNYEGELMIQGRFDLKAQADDKLFTTTTLAIGKEAPEIEGEDSDGVSFKLSDYRGKVVMLDFWGNW